MANSPTSVSGNEILLIIVSVLLPPLGVLLSRGLGTQFLINVVLTVLGYIPGIIHAIWLIARK